MTIIKNTYHKALTFPTLDLNIKANSEKEVTEDQAKEMLKNVYIQKSTESVVKTENKKVDHRLITNQHKNYDN